MRDCKRRRFAYALVQPHDQVYEASSLPTSGAEVAASSDYFPSRYSIAYFAGPNPTTKVGALPGTYIAEEDKVFSAVITLDYVAGGFKDLYGGVKA